MVAASLVPHPLAHAAFVQTSIFFYVTKSRIKKRIAHLTRSFSSDGLIRVPRAGRSATYVLMCSKECGDLEDVSSGQIFLELCGNRSRAFLLRQVLQGLLEPEQ